MAVNDDLVSLVVHNVHQVEVDDLLELAAVAVGDAHVVQGVAEAGQLAEVQTKLKKKKLGLI